MLLKMGVDISKLERPIRRSLNHVQKIFQKYGQEPIITSTYEGNHSPGSLHYAHKAVDFRRHNIPKTTIGPLLQKLRESLGPNYDVILEKSHIHIEYDPK